MSGHVYMIDTTNIESPRIVQRLHIHQTPVLQMAYDTEGRFLITASDDGNVFVADARPSSEFRVVGQTGRVIYSFIPLNKFMCIVNLIHMYNASNI